MTPTPLEGEIKRVEPESEHHCSPVLRSYVIKTGEGEWRRGGPQGRPPSPLGLSKAHIPARPAKGIITSYRGASLMQVRLRGEVTTGKAKSVPRGDIVEFTTASRRRMLELLAKVEQKAVPFFLTLTYPDNFPPYREDYKGHLEAFCDRIQRPWPESAFTSCRKCYELRK